MEHLACISVYQQTSRRWKLDRLSWRPMAQTDGRCVIKYICEFNSAEHIAAHINNVNLVLGFVIIKYWQE